MSDYYIQLFSPHGLIKYHQSEVGKDKDTGGQVKYVLELLEALSVHPSVRKIDLFTRRISDKKVSPAYADEIEIVNEKARIVRISCGGNAYKRKEQLWDHLDEFVDKSIRFMEKQDDYPDVVHGHYADGNYIAAEISKIYAVPFIATGHSLGRNKKNILIKDGWTEEKIDKQFNLSRRINEEEKTLQLANAIIVSTRHEIETQYKDYPDKDETKFTVIPPGINTEIFYPFYRQDMPSFNMGVEQEHALYRINSEIERFLFAPQKPLILSIGRADKRKNFETIIASYGQDKELQAMANLAIFAGVRKDISVMPEEEQEILTNLLLLMDKYDLYGKMAIPKKNDPNIEVPEIYRIAARKKGVFVNATPGENFGLTIVEAAGCGLPVVASPTGGPKEIIGNAGNGILVDVDDTAAIANAMKKIIADTLLWEKYSESGIKAAQKNYTWQAHAKTYIKLIDTINAGQHKAGLQHKSSHTSFGKKLARAKMFFISDLDGTLIEDDKELASLQEIKNWILANRDAVAFGISSGRNKTLTLQAIEEHGLPYPDMMVCSAGTEIYYTKDVIADAGWEHHINHQWKRAAIETALINYPKLQLQEQAAQWPLKLSYYADADFNENDLADLHHYLDEKKLRAKILLTDNKCLDILPVRAGKGNAVRYLGYKWQMPVENIVTAGNGGNDIDMLSGKAKGIVVANYSPELEALKNSRHVYFAATPLSKGVWEGINFYIAKYPALLQP